MSKAKASADELRVATAQLDRMLRGAGTEVYVAVDACPDLRLCLVSVFMMHAREEGAKLAYKQYKRVARPLTVPRACIYVTPPDIEAKVIAPLAAQKRLLVVRVEANEWWELTDSYAVYKGNRGGQPYILNLGPNALVSEEQYVAYLLTQCER